MSTTKTALTITSIGTALLFGGGIYLYMNLGSIAKTLAQDYASKALGVSVKIGKIDIDIPNLEVDVHRVKISNPPGYTAPHALSIQNITIAAQSLSRSMLHFKQVSINGVDIHAEINEQGSNFTTIQNNIKTDAGQPSGEAVEPVKFIIDSFSLDGKITPHIGFIDKTLSPVELTPPLVLKKIGQKENGVLAGEAIAQIWTPLSKTVISTVQNAGYLEGISLDTAKEIGLQKVESIKKKLDDKIGDKVKSLGGGLKNIFD